MAKEKTIIELREEKKSLSVESRGILAKAQEEKRKLTAEESDKLDANEMRQREINIEIEERNDLNNSQFNREGQKESRRASLVRLLRNQMMGIPQSGPEADLVSRASERAAGLEAGGVQVPFETRSPMTTSSGVSNGVIDQDNMDIVLPLEKKLVFAEAGATMLTGLKGDIAFPGLSDVTVAWDAETDNAADGTPSHSSALKLTPKRLCAYCDISKQLLVQENQDIEGYVRNLIAVAVAQKLENTALGKAASGDAPAGIFYTAPTLKGDFSWANVVAMETTVNEAGGVQGNLAYILHSKIYGAAKTLPKHTSSAGGLIIDREGNMLNGYKCLNTGNVATQLETAPAVGSTPAVNDGYGAIFGNWADFVIANWGNLDITIDNLTQAVGGKVRLVLNTWWNYGMTRTASFKTGAFAVD